MTAAIAPPRPNPWTTTDPREALRDTNAARIISMTPGMTAGPGGDYPANMVDFCGHDENYVQDVRFTGQKAMVLRSLTQHVHNGGSGGVCEPIGHALQVRAGGSAVIRHGDGFYMDDRKTVGEAQFVRNTASYPPPQDADPLPGSVATTMAADSNVHLAQYAPGASAPGATRFAPSPGLSPPTTAPASPPSTAPTSQSPPGQPGGPRQGPQPGLRYGLYGYVLSDMLGRQQMSDADRATEDEAQAIWQSPEGQQTIREQNLMWGRNHGSLLDPSLREATPYGVWIKPEDRVPLANDILSARAGRQVDLRTAPAGEVRQLMDWDAPAAPDISTGGNTRISEEERRKRCRVDKYSVMKDACGSSMQAHHIVPDYTLRYGNRGQGEAGEKRIPGLPSFDDGMSICLTGNARLPAGYQLQPGDPDREHAWAHTADSQISALGDQNRPLGTTPMSDIILQSVKSVSQAKPECAKEISEAVIQQYDGRNLSQLGRTTQTLPRGEAAQVLPRGATQSNWQEFSQ